MLSSTTSTRYPSFESLPLDKAGPHGNAWGLYGADDQLGTLNHLTDATVAAAAKEEISEGTRISLNWSMTALSWPAFPRGILTQKITNKAPSKIAHDDEWSFNTQCSSQWDGCRHYGYQKEKVYFMGRTAEDFAKSVVPNGVQHMSAKGIAGRAVLIDWYAWARSQDRTVNTMSSDAIPFSELIQTLEHQGMSLSSFRPGDIMVVRFGYTKQYQELAEPQRMQLHEKYKSYKPENIGVQPSKSLLKFLWDYKISAVAGDSRSFEVWPCEQLDWHLHEWLIAGWGMPIGELFDLEELSRKASETKRYTFFLTSSPMNVPGGVASPPNALAFF